MLFVKKEERINEENIKNIFKDCDDFEMKNLYLSGDRKKQIGICFIDGLVSGNEIGDSVIRPLMLPERFEECRSQKEAFDFVMHGGVYGYSVKEVGTLEEAASDVLNGFCLLVFDKISAAAAVEVKNPEKRSVDVPSVEKVVKGAKDALVETLRVNTSLVRKKIRNPQLKISETTAGGETKTKIAVLYIDGLTDPELVSEVKKRVENIRTNGLISSANLEENICDDVSTPFPQMVSTERTDKFSMNLLEGRVGILVDGLPLGFFVPGTFGQFMKAPEDNSKHYIIASMLTLLRYFSLMLTLLLPALYVAVAVFHQEMMPTKLMLSIINSKEDVPFATIEEVIGMLVAFELLQEAGLHLPQPVGETVSIIGALIVGQSAVEAKVISPAVVIVIAIAGIAGYAVPNQDMSYALRMWRFILVLAAMLGGMFAIALAAALMIDHLCGIESFGVPYTTPFSTGKFKEMAKAILRLPLKKCETGESPCTVREEKKLPH